MKDEILPEYDLKTLQVRRMGAKRTQFGNHIVALEPDVASVFPDAATVNAALRFLMKMTQENPLSATPPPKL